VRLRVFALAVVLCIALGHVSAQEATSETCDNVIGRYTATGIELSGSGSMITEPVTLKQGILIADAHMTAAGAIKILNAAGDYVLLANSTDAYDGTKATKISEAGGYLIGAEFYGDPGDWSVTLSQPSA
jgi:hypothetical protein